MTTSNCKFLVRDRPINLIPHQKGLPKRPLKQRKVHRDTAIQFSHAQIKDGEPARSNRPENLAFFPIEQVKCTPPFLSTKSRVPLFDEAETSEQRNSISLHLNRPPISSPVIGKGARSDPLEMPASASKAVIPIPTYNRRNDSRSMEVSNVPDS
ncbi:hypothetical protein JTE90_025405 [Oedothorax gibbosus]|uniref:Uncharacterized protein n=1 Tax=Oedothorax gibbosus TaxID=931172 RepID=A0AAV6UIX2_9ARAC|nr:hypothetical protein JTE90_025405 [Oedothorax gibbosus]